VERGDALAPAMPESSQTSPGWTRVVLGLACVAAIVVAVLVVGPASSARQSTRRVITVEKGVVQSTVSASGSLQPARQLDVNFKAGGTLRAIDVRAGQHVYQGQLLAELDPSAATVAVQQAQASLQAAEAKLAAVESDPSGSATTPATAAATTTAPTATAATAAATTAAATTATTAAATTATTAAATKATPGAEPAATAPKKPKAQPAAAATKPKTTTTTAAPTISPATRAANLASARAVVASAELGVRSAQIGLDNTRLYAPASGTIASLAATQPGDTVAGGATGRASPAASSGGGTTGSTGAASAAASSTASSAFIVLDDLSGMDLVVPLSEADITKVRPGQPASVTVNALPGSDLAAHVTSVATLPTSNGGVVSYDVTLHLRQLQFGLRPGMTASTQIVVSRAQGAVSLPSAAIARAGGESTVTVVRGGKDVVQPIVTGIVGDSTTQVVSGLSGGEQVAITTATNLGSGAAAGGLGGAARALGGGGGLVGGGGLAGGGGRRGGP
jgi:multidrug efflux pump subunit AcrA (membrane-fusion protein)